MLIPKADITFSKLQMKFKKHNDKFSPLSAVQDTYVIVLLGNAIHAQTFFSDSS